MADRTSAITLPSGRMPKAFSAEDATQLTPTAAGTAYRYLRILQTTAQASGYLELQRCDFFDADGAYCHPAMTAASTPSPLVESSSETAFGGEDWMAFTRTTANRWHTNTPSTAEWLAIDMGSGNEKAPAAIGLSWSNSTTRFMPTLKVQGSTTGSWGGEEVDIWDSSVKVGTWTSSTWLTNGAYRIFWFDKDYTSMPIG